MSPATTPLLLSSVECDKLMLHVWEEWSPVRGKGGATVAALDIETESSRARCGFGKTQCWCPSSKRSDLDATLGASYLRFGTSERKKLGRNGGSPSKWSGVRHATVGCMDTKFIRGCAGLQFERGGGFGLDGAPEPEVHFLSSLPSSTGRTNPPSPPFASMASGRCAGRGEGLAATWRFGSRVLFFSFLPSSARKPGRRRRRETRSHVEDANRRQPPRGTNSHGSIESTATTASHGLA